MISVNIICVTPVFCAYENNWFIINKICVCIRKVFKNGNSEFISLFVFYFIFIQRDIQGQIHFEIFYFINNIGFKKNCCIFQMIFFFILKH